MTIYAIFLCGLAYSGCLHADGVGSHIIYQNGEPVGVSDFFASRSECDQEMRKQLGPGAETLYRCLGRHVDVWN